MVIPKRLREDVGLLPGQVEVSTDGTGVRIEPMAGDSLGRRGGRLVIPAGGGAVTDELVQALRDAGQR